MNPIIIGIAAFLLYNLYTQSNVINDALQYKFSGLKLLRSSTSVYITGLQTNMELVNPTNVSGQILSISGTAKIKINENIYQAGRYYIPQRFTIPANGSVVVPVQIAVTNTEAAKAILNMVSALKLPTLILTGTINTTIGNIPFTTELSA